MTSIHTSEINTSDNTSLTKDKTGLPGKFPRKIKRLMPKKILKQKRVFLKISRRQKRDSEQLREFPDLQDFISGYLSDKIAELEKQLEEL